MVGLEVVGVGDEEESEEEDSTVTDHDVMRDVVVEAAVEEIVVAAAVEEDSVGDSGVTAVDSLVGARPLESTTRWSSLLLALKNEM